MTRPLRVMAIDPTTRGFGFVVFEGPTTLVDWGERRGGPVKNRDTLAKVADMITRYSPEVLVLEDAGRTDTRRCARVRRLLWSLRHLAIRKGVNARGFSPSLVRRAFGTATKHQIAQITAVLVPELAPLMPRVRKPWMTEDHRTAIFDAAALALTYFQTRGLLSPPLSSYSPH